MEDVVRDMERKDDQSTHKSLLLPRKGNNQRKEKEKVESKQFIKIEMGHMLNYLFC